MEIIPLKKLAITQSGGTPSRRKPSNFMGKINWLKSGELNDGLVLSSEEKISEEALNKSSAKIFPAGTALIAMYGATAGKTAVLGEDAATNQAICAIIPKKNNLDSHYVQYYLVYKRSDLLSMRIGGAQPNLNQEIIKNIEFPFCPLSQQQRIVSKIDEIFSKLDAGQSALKHARANLNRYRQSLLASAFSGELTKKWREEHKGELEPASELLKRIRGERRARWAEDLRAKGKDPNRYTYTEPESADTSELPDLPEGWIWVRLEEITLPVKKVKPREKPEEIFFYIDISSVNNSKLQITRPKRYKGSNAPSRARQLVHTGDVLFSSVRTYLKNITLVPRTYNNQIASTGFIVLRTPLIELNQYIFYYIQQDEYISEISLKQRGVSYPAIRPEDLLDTFLPLPPHNEMERISSLFFNSNYEVNNLERIVQMKYIEVGKLKKAILEKAFSGHLV